jgi:hypothetical protein
MRTSHKSLKLLTAWNFSIEDMKFINELRSFHNPPKPPILYIPYSKVIENAYASMEEISGVLPYLDMFYCPSLYVPFKLRC